MLLRGRKHVDEYRGTVVEIQRNGKFRVRLNDDERICVSNLTREQAEEVDRALGDAYHLGTTRYVSWPRPDHDDE